MFQVQGMYINNKNDKIIEVKIIDIKNKTHSLKISNQATGYQLKQYLYNNLCKQLEPKLIKLTEAGRIIQNNIKLSDFNPTKDKTFIFLQQKIDLILVSSLLAQQKEDPIYSQNYTYEWPCGHLIGKHGMVDLIRTTIKKGENLIKCPYLKQNGEICGNEWNFRLCKKIGIFTKGETEQFEKGRNQNWIKHNTKNFPKCNQPIYKGAKKTNRVKCLNVKCNNKDLCYLCLNPWISKQEQFCGNVDCQFNHEILIKAEWNRKFQLKDTKNKGKLIWICTPKYRACPNCRMVVQNYIYCKHTECTHCKKKFCWVCLSVLDKNWKCGASNDYCGIVAPVQNLMLIK